MVYVFGYPLNMKHIGNLFWVGFQCIILKVASQGTYKMMHRYASADDGFTNTLVKMLENK